MNYTTLNDEITNGPLAVSLQSLIANGQMQGVANLLNDKTGSAAESHAITGLAKNDFLKATAIIAIRLALLVGADGSAINANVAKKWQAALDQARAADPGSNIDLTLIAALGDPVADNVLSSKEYAALIPSRQLSRAEILFGVGTDITSYDIQMALSL